MFEQLGNLISDYNPGNVATPVVPVPIQTQPTFYDKFKAFSTPASQGGSGKLEGLVTALDMIGRGLDKRAGGKGEGFGGLETARSSLASKANKERQSEFNSLLSQLIGGLTPGTNPGGNKITVSPNEDGSLKIDHSLTAPSENPPQNNFLGEDMANFPLF